jgi:hypothetical protein
MPTTEAAPPAAASRKAIREAVAYFEKNLSGVRRGTHRCLNLHRRIEQSLRPMATAKAIIKDLNKAALKSTDRRTSAATIPDHGDIQELRVRLIKSNHWLDPQVRGILHRLDIKAAHGELLVDDLDNAADIIGSLKHTVSSNSRWGERRGEIA